MSYLIALILLISFNPAISTAQTSTETKDGSSVYEGDVEQGSVVYFRCQACHDISKRPSGEVKSGPNLYGIFGKKVGSVEGFENYSKALKDADFIWDEEKLDNWLKNPNIFLPGNTMAFSGVLRHEDRVNLISFIREQNDK